MIKEKEKEKAFDQKIKRLDGWLIQIVVNVFVSVMTTTIILYLAGITF